MTKQLLAPIRQRFYDIDGHVLSGGKLYTYKGGSARAATKPTYAPNGAANTNPVVLDAAGEADVWVEDGPYLFVLCDASGVEIWSRDNIAANATSDIISVRYYGAKGDGVTDDTNAVNAAIAALAPGSTLLFPFGTYPVSTGLNFNGLTDITVVSEGATLKMIGAITGVSIINCTNFRSSGPLNINGTTGAIGLSMSGNSKSGLMDWKFSGNIKAGTLSAPANVVYGGIAVPDSTPLVNFEAIGCANGFEAVGEYYQFSNPVIKGCAGYGLLITGGSVSVTGGQINGNRIGIKVLGGVVGNSDHGKIEGCTINHNLAVGIYLKNLTYAFQVTGCIIGGSIGDGTANGQLSEEGRVTSFAMYGRNVQHLNVSGNTFIRNAVQVGLDGITNSVIAENVFIADPDRTTDHIVEYGANGTIPINAQNVYAPNVYGGTLFGGSNKRIKLLTSNLSLAHMTKGSVGNTGNQTLKLDSTVVTPQTLDGNADYVHMTSDCTAVITIAPCQSFGQAFCIVFTQVAPGATKQVTLTSNNGTTILCSGLSAAGDVLTLSEAGLYTFWPNSVQGTWVVTKERGGTDAPAAPALLNSWANVGGVYSNVGYFKDGNGTIHIRGRISGGANATVIFTLPAGYRPSVTLSPSVNASAGKTAYIEIANTGNVTVFYDAGATFISLDGCIFSPI